MADIDAFARAEADALVAELSEWCAIPSISGDPDHAADVRRSAEHLAGLMEAAGLDTEVLAADGGLPAVYGEWLGAGTEAPTITVYGHHDVQPVDPLEEWTTPPFEPTVRDGWLHARGASDDKGQIHFQVSAIRHLLAADGRLPVNVKFLVEGEEESGSPTIDTLLGEHAERLACDLILVSDTGMVAEDVPSLVTAMRGLIYFQVDLRTAPADLHSGSFGGAVPNAIAELVALLAGLKDDAGRIAIPGWYDDVVALTEEERANFADLPFDPEQFKAVTGVGDLPGEEGFSPLERMSGRPTADLNGIWGGFTGVGTKTIIPAEAHAKVSFRLVADQEPARLEPLFERWVRQRAPGHVEVSVQSFGGVKPTLTPLDHPGNRAAAEAVARAFGRRPLFTREGGSGPERALSDALGAACVYLGVMLPEDRIHAPNERLLLANYYRGMRAAAYALEEFAKPEVASALRNPAG
ncbi:MAG TPA: dipeptidase [Actinomycetota bacterium]|jgi:acetylornithine deacetylase/succinyl-diaminopimelate desuccinylase-like protein|nr:dipeptidase [Actinomycetota bacterium]